MKFYSIYDNESYYYFVFTEDEHTGFTTDFTNECLTTNKEKILEYLILHPYSVSIIHEIEVI